MTNLFNLVRFFDQGVDVYNFRETPNGNRTDRLVDRMYLVTLTCIMQTGIAWATLKNMPIGGLIGARAIQHIEMCERIIFYAMGKLVRQNEQTERINHLNTVALGGLLLEIAFPQWKFIRLTLAALETAERISCLYERRNEFLP